MQQIFILYLLILFKTYTFICETKQNKKASFKGPL